jgi:hypothetical protein
MLTAFTPRVNTLHIRIVRVALGFLAVASVSVAQAVNGVNGPAAVPDGGSNMLLLSAGAVGSLLVIRRFLKK